MAYGPEYSYPQVANSKTLNGLEICIIVIVVHYLNMWQNLSVLNCCNLQNIYSPYMGQQYLQIYGVPGTVNSTVYPYGQLGQPLSSGYGYSTVPDFSMPGQHIVQFSSASGVTAASLPTIQLPYPRGNC